MKRLHITQPGPTGRVIVAEGCLFGDNSVVLLAIGAGYPALMYFSDLAGLEAYISDEGVGMEWID